MPMYELRYRYGASSEPAIEHADLNDDGQAAVRAVRELLGMPSRHAVEVRREGVLIFCRTRTRLVPGDDGFRLKCKVTQSAGTDAIVWGPVS